MALTQTDLETLDAAIAQGELRVEMAGRSVTYRSVGELIAARNHVASVLASEGVTGGPRRTGAYRVTFSTARGG
jgi:hypothetical protein